MKNHTENLNAILVTALLVVACGAHAQQNRFPEERIDLPGVWRCLVPRGPVAILNINTQGDFTLNGFSSRYTVQGNILSTVAGNVTTQYRIRQAGDALTMESAAGRYSCQRGATGSLA